MTNTQADPRDRSMESWRARLAVLASRGETDGPRVTEARRGLAWHRCKSFFDREVGRGALAPATRDQLLALVSRDRGAN